MSIVSRWACTLVITVLAAGQCSGSSSFSKLFLSILSKDTPTPPRFPKNYEVSYNFTLPFESELQPDGLTFPVRVWRDSSLGKVRQDTYGGVNSLIATEEVNLEIFPKIDKLACAKVEMDPGEKGLLEIPIIPDVSGWEYTGMHTVNGQTTYVWEYAKTHGDKHTRYEFYSSEDGDPVRLYMHGNDLFSGAHFDVWIADYYTYIPGHPDPAVFDIPDICDGKLVEEHTGRSSFAMQMGALVPAVTADGELRFYDEVLGLRGMAAASGSQRELAAKSLALSANMELIQEHNAKPNRTYSLEANRFAYWTQEEFEGIMLPRHKHKRGLVARRPSSAKLPYARKVPKGRLPGSVDWRGSAADQHVLDQAACGSCWAFGAAGTLQGAHFLATGKKGYFSEQQMMDCSWGYGLNQACDGGDYDAAMDYLKKAGGMASGTKYKYLGADGFCQASNFTSDQLTPFEGYAYVPQYDDEALMEAVYSRGPIAVSLDASQPSFRFYSGGVMDEPNCMWKSEDLDHAVLLVGYGTCPETGLDYWLIRNSWSTHWGDNGYVKISRRHGCGITTDPVYAVFKPTQDTAVQQSAV